MWQFSWSPGLKYFTEEKGRLWEVLKTRKKNRIVKEKIKIQTECKTFEIMFFFQYKMMFSGEEVSTSAMF